MPNHLDLSERDARLLTTKIVERLRALGGRPQQFGIALRPEGFVFTAVMDGRLVTVRTGQGNFRYEDIAREMAILAADPVDDGARIISITEPAKPKDPLPVLVQA